MKKIITSFMIAVIIVSCLAPCSFAVYEDEHYSNEIMKPRYDIISNISMDFDISSSGRANCSATVIIPSGYRVDVTVELQQKVGREWNTIHDWTASGKNFVTISDFRYVLSGHSYRLKVTANTYDSNGNLVEDPVEYSPIRNY